MTRTPFPFLLMSQDPAEEAPVNVAKAKKPAAKVPVYSQDGRLIGLVDEHDLEPVQTGGGKAEPAPAAQPPVDQQAADVVAGVAKAFDGLRPKPAHLRKAVGVAPAGAGWSTLLKSLDAGRAQAVQSAVGAEALKLMLTGVPSKRAVAIAKAAAVRFASARGLV